MVAHALIPALERLRQEDHEFKTSLGYAARPVSKTKKQKTLSLPLTPGPPPQK
jgi:hypothetical protein